MMKINENFGSVDPQIAAEFYRAFENQAISHSYLFISQDNVVAQATAKWLMGLFLCENVTDDGPDGTCRNCQRLLEQEHPDVFIVHEIEKQSLGIYAIRPLKEELAKSPAEGDRRFFLINEAQKLTLPAANALLNLLEEPIAPVITILVTNNVNQILPTIVSRTQLVNFTGIKETEATKPEIDNLTEIINLAKELQQHLVNNQPAIVSLKKIEQLNLNKNAQKYLFEQIMDFADTELRQGLNLSNNNRLLQILLKINEMRSFNVGFNSCLNYLILMMEF